MLGHFGSVSFRPTTNLTHLQIDLPPNHAEQSEYTYDGDPRIKRAIKALYQHQGRMLRDVIDRALVECIEDFKTALFQQDHFLTEVDCEKMESWLKTRKPLIGRLHIFAKAHNETRGMIDELLNSYDDKEGFKRRTLERLIETVLLGNLEGVDPIQ